MTTVPILYSFRRCPYAIRARLAIGASGVTVLLREVVLRDKPAAMIAASPKATVPVLVLPDGVVIDESLAIMRWSLAHHDPDGWLTRDDPALVAVNDGAFKHHLDRYKYADRHPADGVDHRAAATDILRALDARIARHGALVGDRPGLADMAIFPFVRQFAATDRDYFDGLRLPALRGWLDRLAESPFFATVMRRQPAWREGDAPVVFP